MDGLEEGVGIELVVLVVALVLVLLRPSVETESLDCGRRMPVGSTLCDRALVALLLLPAEEGESIEDDDTGRNAVGAEAWGLEVRRRSFSLSLPGDGESSMIRTHPEVSAPAGVVALPGVLFSASMSMLCLRDFGIGANRSSRECDEDVEGAGEAEAFTGTGGGGIALAALRLVTLPMRSRGTRV